MRIEYRGRRAVRRLAATTFSAALVTGLVLAAPLSVQAAGATVTVTQDQIRPDETTYPGWHQGVAASQNPDVASSYAVTAKGLSMFGHSQVLNGFDTPQAGTNLREELLGAKYTVTDGKIWFQVPITFTNTTNPGGVFTTLRPNYPATAGDHTIALTDIWTANKALGPGMLPGGEYPLGDMLDALEAGDATPGADDLVYGFGVFSDPDFHGAVSDITWAGTKYRFVADGTTETIPVSDLQGTETPENYHLWHQGYSSTQVTSDNPADVTAEGLKLAGRSQILKGYDDHSSDISTGRNANLPFVLQDASYTVKAGSDPVNFQIALYSNNVDSGTFATIRNVGPKTGKNEFFLDDMWRSSAKIGAVAKDTSVPLGDLIAALGSEYKVVGFGVVTDRDKQATVTNITFDGTKYKFDQDPQPNDPPSTEGVAPGSTEDLEADITAGNVDPAADLAAFDAGGTGTTAGGAWEFRESGPATNATMEWSDPADEWVDVYAYSTPTFVGTFPVVGGVVVMNGLSLSNLPVGPHYLVLIGTASQTVAAVPLSVTAAPGTPGGGTTEPPVGTTDRLGGANRYETNQQVYDAADRDVTTVVLSSGRDFPDALSANYLAKSLNAGVLLTTRDSLPKEVKERLTANGTKNVYITGGYLAVNKSVEDEIRAMSPKINVIRVQGGSRYDTNQAANGVARASGGTVFLATGETYSDALALAPVSYGNGWPIVLTNGSALRKSAADQIAAIKPDRIVIAGGTLAVPQSVHNALVTEGYRVERLDGRTGNETAAAVATWATQDLTGGDKFTSPTLNLTLGTTPWDALSAGQLAGSLRQVVLPTASATELGSGLISYLKAASVTAPATGAKQTQITSIRPLGQTLVTPWALIDKAQAAVGAP